jgi:hypothetical protein
MKWLQWILDNAWTLIIVGTVLAQLFQAIVRKKEGPQKPSEEEPPREYEFEDPELAERTRKIREEIQRKIAQRQRGGAEQDAAEAPAPAAYESETPPPLIREVVAPRPVTAAGTRLDTQRQAEILEQQAAWAEKLQEAQRMKASALKRTEFETATADHSQAARTISRVGVLDDLRSPAALRRAFILREVLGPPVALRK